MNLFSVIVIALTLFSSVEAATCSSKDDNSGVYSERHTALKVASAREADNTANLAGRTNREPSAPAYTDYIGYRFVPTTASAQYSRTPDLTGAW